MSNTNTVASWVILAIAVIMILGGAYLIYLGIMAVLAAAWVSAIIELIVGIALVLVGIYLINRRHTIVA